MSRLLAILLALILAVAARAQTAFTIDCAARRQTIEGLGFTATGTWIPAVNDLYSKPEFAEQIHKDLNPSIIRLALPPAFQKAEDLDTLTLNPALFDPAAFNPPANFIQNLHKLQPDLKVIFSVWSPPAWMKDNNSTIKGGHLRDDRRPHFAKFCAAACQLFEKTYGVPVYALSIQNEPVFTQPYDSCIYTPGEMRDTIKTVAAAFRTHGVKTLIMAPEDVHDTTRVMTFVDAIRADEQSLAATSIINFHGVPSKGWPDLRARIAPLNKPLWVTETSGQSPDWNGGLAVATEIHNALSLGDCSAWVYWALTDPKPSEYALMGLAAGTGKSRAAAHYLKFIRPRMQRVSVTPASATILVSAFADDRSLVINLINLNTSDASLTLAIQSPPGSATMLRRRCSTADARVELPGVAIDANHVAVTLPPQSVTTFSTTDK